VQIMSRKLAEMVGRNGGAESNTAYAVLLAGIAVA